MQTDNCPDCGPAPTNHTIQYFSVLIAFISTPADRFLSFIKRRVFAPIFLPMQLDRLALPVFKTLTRMGLGLLIEKPDEQNSSRARVLWESANKLGIKMVEFRPFKQPHDTFVAVYKNHTKFFYELPRPSKPLSAGYDWMDDKPTMKKIFYQNGIPVAIGGSCFTFSKALKIFRSIGDEVIVKPSVGSRSRHTTVHIKDEAQLRIAFDKAKQLSPFVVVEQQLVGDVYRATVIGGKLAAVLSRNLPTVTGDGISTIQELVNKENQNPKRAYFFHPIPLDAEAQKELQRQKLTFDSIPSMGQQIYLSDKVSRGVGAVTSDVTDKTHSDNIFLFEKIAQVVDDTIIGIDFIIGDISVSWKNQNRCGVIECNSVPFVDLHHYPFEGQARNVSALIWQMIFPIQQRVAEIQQ